MNQKETKTQEKEKSYLGEAKIYLLSHLDESNFQFIKGLKIFFSVSALVYLSFFFYYQEKHFLFFYGLPFVFLTLFIFLFPSFYKKDKVKTTNVTLILSGILLSFHFYLFFLSDPYFYFIIPGFFFIITCIVGYLLANNKVFTLVFIGILGLLIYMFMQISSSYIYKTGNLKFNYFYPSLFSFYFILSYVSLFFWILYHISSTLYGILDELPNILNILTAALSTEQESYEENLALKSEIGLASKLQYMVLPQKKEEIKISKKFNVDIAGRMDPAEEVGGDYYDILVKGDDLYMGIGDVTDHGMESGLIMLICQSSFKNSLYQNNMDIKQSLLKANKAVYELGSERMETGRTMSLSFARYTKDGQFLLTGQHEKLIVCRQGKKIEWVETGDLGFIIGITDEIQDYVSEQSLHLEIGDSVLFYTDGANEAENEKKKQLGEESVGNLFLKYNSLSSKKILDSIYQDIYKFIGRQVVFDDITMLCLKRI